MQKNLVDPLLPGRYGRMSARELDREVEIFDREFIADAARPLSAQNRARLKRPRQGRSRSTE